MTEATQTVAQDTNVQVPPDTAAAGAQTEEIDLDALLNEWGATGEEAQATETVKVEPKKDNPTSEPDETKQVIDYVKQQMVRTQDEELKKINEEYQKTVTSLKGDLPVDDDLVDGFLRIKASKDPRVLSAYQNRHKSPEKWSKIEQGLRQELKGKIKAMPDKGATDTRSQIAGAIQNSQSSSSYQAEKPLKDMTDQEFYQHQQAFINS